MGQLTRFDLQEFLGLIQKYRVTTAPIVPPIVLAMAKHPAVAQFDLSSLRLIFSGAAPLGEEIARELSRRLGCPVVRGYAVLKPDEPSRATKADAIMAWVAGRVAPHKRIRHIEFIDQIPKSASGKILRRVLVDMERSLS